MVHTSFKWMNHNALPAWTSVYPTCTAFRMGSWIMIPNHQCLWKLSLNQKIGFEWATQRRLSLSFCLGKKNDDVVLVRVDFLQLF